MLNRNIEHLFAARNVAIVGVSADNIYAMGLIDRVQRGAKTKLVGVNRRHAEVAGVACVPSISDLPRGIDAAFIGVSAAGVMQALRECNDAHIPAAVVVAAGFADSRIESDRSRQSELAQFAKSTGMAICGPSCLGIANIVDGYYIFGSVAAGAMLRGRIGAISQSGGILSALVRSASRRGLGFSHLISSGTEACLDTCDYLEFLIGDKSTDVICMFCEKIADTERYIELAGRASLVGKAIFCIKIGRSSEAARAAIGHTGVLTGSDTFYETMFADTGVQRCWSVEEMMDRVSLLAQSDRSAWPGGNRVGIVTVSGGTGTIFADLCSAYGLSVPALEPETAARLQAAFPDRVRVDNPIDVSAHVQRQYPDVWSMSVEAVASSTAADVVLVADNQPLALERITTLSEIRDRTGIPIAVTPVGDGFEIFSDEVREEADRMLLPLLTGGEPAVRALSAAAGVALARRRTRDRAEQWWSGEAIAMAGLDGPVSAEEAMIWAGDEVALRRFLSAAGLSVPNEFLYDGPSAMELDTKSFTFPVAVKVADQRIVHKAAAGLMRLGVENREAAVRAGDEIWHRFVLGHEGDSPTGLVVQEMVAGGCYEMYVATLCEAGERPVVTVGKGGYSVESAADVSRRLAPVSLGDARGMLAELRTGHQLRDLDVDAAANAIVAIANAALLLRKGVRMMEFNPIIVRPKGQGAFLVDTVIDPLIPGSGMDL